MKRLRVALALGMLSAAWAASDPLEITEVVFVPPRFYVGDRAEVRLSLASTSAFTMESPAELPQKRWLSVDEVEVLRPTDRSATVRVFFTSFLPGTQALPEIALGDVVLRDIKISTSSLLEAEGGTEPRPLRSQLVLPGTWPIALGLAFGIVVVPVGLILVVRAVLGAGRRYRARTLRRLPARRLKRRLARLGRLTGQIDVREFFIRATEALKRYLQERLRVPALGSTTLELSNLAKDVLPGAALENALRILHLADEVKFAGKPFRRENLSWVLRSLEDLAVQVEEALDVDL